MLAITLLVASLLDARRTLAVLYNKPRGLVTTHRDELNRETVYDRLLGDGSFPPEFRAMGWHAVGRLDANTTGLLVLTNDGGLVHAVTNPTVGTEAAGPVRKTYRARVMGLLDDASLGALRSGVDLGGGLGFSQPAEVEVESTERTSSWVRLTVCEGKNRQVGKSILTMCICL